MKRTILSVAVALFATALFVNVAAAEDKAKTVSGKSACATCDGVTDDGHSIMLVAEDGTRWVLKGEGDDYKAAHKVRKDGKTMTAKLKGEPKTEKDSDGKEFMVAQVESITVEG